VAFVHDEIIVEIVEGGAHEGLIELERLMAEGANMYLHRVPVHTEGVCMRRWSKNAELAYDLDGRVIPWDKKAEGSP
jgi:DNA polymerase I-like protein with 3'-5' exonuclease and polymerase domains